MIERPNPFDQFSDEWIAAAVEANRAHLAKRPSWKVGEAVVRVYEREQERRGR